VLEDYRQYTGLSLVTQGMITSVPDAAARNGGAAGEGTSGSAARGNLDLDASHQT